MYYCVLTLSMYGYPKKVSCILGKKVLDYSFQEALKGIQEEGGGGPKAFFFMSFFPWYEMRSRIKFVTILNTGLAFFDVQGSTTSLYL